MFIFSQTSDVVVAVKFGSTVNDISVGVHVIDTVYILLETFYFLTDVSDV